MKRPKGEPVRSPSHGLAMHLPKRASTCVLATPNREAIEVGTWAPRGAGLGLPPHTGAVTRRGALLLVSEGWKKKTEETRAKEK